MEFILFIIFAIFVSYLFWASITRYKKRQGREKYLWFFCAVSSGLIILFILYVTIGTIILMTQFKKENTIFKFL